MAWVLRDFAVKAGWGLKEVLWLRRRIFPETTRLLKGQVYYIGSSSTNRRGIVSPNIMVSLRATYCS